MSGVFSVRKNMRGGGECGEIQFRGVCVKKSLSGFIVFAAVFSLFAHGKSDIEETDVANLNSWQEVFDLESKKAGKYNMMITATDKGGNQYVEGPFNLFVDPLSDLPVAGITNPASGMRVAGNLNIVGTCVDDDAVSWVELVLDGDTENPIRAEGKEFWSYYLDTVDMAEGPHKIQVTGYDINGLAGHPVSVEWQLDRSAPVTQVADPAMGMLVSGNVNLKGTVSDGNGIREMSYSIDGGEKFSPVKLPKNQAQCSFSINIDTRKFEDGPSVIWFKAVDRTGSVGYYAFLLFIDNTKPDVQIVSPEADAVMNGKFSVAGYAKDTMGIVELSWKFGDETGDFELIPGNPYWCVTLDTIGSSDKSRKFTIHAKDSAGNVVEVTRNIALNQEQDKAVVLLSEPEPQTVYSDGKDVFVRGIAVDDDGIQSVFVQLDDGDAEEIRTRGTFQKLLCDSDTLSVGKHKITVYAVDVNGVAGAPLVTEISTTGLPPVFSDVRIVSSKNSEAFSGGMEIHPESGTSLEMNISSQMGISEVVSELRWGRDGIIERNDVLKNPKEYRYVWNFGADAPKGAAEFVVRATDITGRTAEFRSPVYITDTYRLRRDVPEVVFDDSVVSEDGLIESDFEFPATGYFIGADAFSAELVPPTPFASVQLDGNLIKLVPGKDAVGFSEPVVVRVTAADGKTFDSRPLRFRHDNVFPQIKIDGGTDSVAFRADGGAFSVSGEILCGTEIKSAAYRILSVSAEIKNSVISAVKDVPFPQNFTEIQLGADGRFSFDVYPSEVPLGMHVIEIVAETVGGNSSSAASAFSTIPDVHEVNGKMPSPKPPVIRFVDGVDAYGLALFQGELDRNFQVFRRDDMSEGANQVVMTVTDSAGKILSGKFTVNKKPTLSAVFAAVNGEPYFSGKTVVLDGASDSGSVTVLVDSGAAVSSVSYEIYGDEVPGGTAVQKGNAKLQKPEDGSSRWSAEIPLSGLPVRINRIKATVKAGGLERTITGSVAVVREEVPERLDDDERIYGFASAGAKYNEVSNTYHLIDECTYGFYMNIRAPFSVSLESATDGLALRTDGRLVTLYPEKPGRYDNVRVTAVDALGNTFFSDYMNFVADSSRPELNLVSPESFVWTGDTVSISGTAADPLGIESVEYSFDGGNSWKPFDLSASDRTNSAGVAFSVQADLSGMDDGLVRIDVRAVDTAGLESCLRTAVHKDTTPPEVTVIEPTELDVVNGMTTLVFGVKDKGLFASADYIAPPHADSVPARTALELNPLVSLVVGTENCPIDEAMSFEFRDEAGNSTFVEAWDFSIDSLSDLPRAEIHTPEDNQVLTRDFTVSGVVYDDDGESTIFYKIDDGEYVRLPEMGTSFSVDIPLLSMTDNEHTVTVYAVDINGVKGEEVSRKFRISLEEPKGSVVAPTIDTSVRGVTTISGVASDKNGIAKVQLSLDNGNSYSDAEGTESWSYTFDTRAVPGGTQVVFLKITDNYGIQGLYSSLVNIDNEAPLVQLELPLDDSATTGMLFFSGFTYDNVEVTELYVSIRNLGNPGETEIRPIKIDRIIGETLDITGLDDGFYNVELTGKDKAGNSTNVSRNIHLEKNRPPAVVDVLYPMNGEHKQGIFNIYGQASAEGEIRELRLYVDGKFISGTELTSSGFFKFAVTPETMDAGVHTYHVDTVLESGREVSSREQTLTYSPSGPWITIDNFTYGDFATGRPYIKGQAGYSISEEELLLSKTKEASKELKDAVAAKTVAKIELSFDNGKSFMELSNNEKWMYRIENQDIAEGYHFMLLRATMKNGETAITRTIVQIDNTKPTIRLISPTNGGRYNQRLDVSGLSNDDVGLDGVRIALRKGDKAAYQVPSFIQGLYVDFNFWGATLFDIGVGLTFFDDVVRVQLQWGEFTQAQRDVFSMTKLRYGGDVFGIKILANIAQLPFSYFFGHDWEWLSASFALGANFSYFTETNSGRPQILSALLGQIEFPRVSLPQLKMFSTFSLYTEGSLWFIPTDVSSTVSIKNIIPQISAGIRVNIF